MARNNNRPRVNNRTRNLSSFIPQPRSSIVDNDRIQGRPLEPFQVYSNSQEIQNYRDWMQSMEAIMWARSSTQPVWVEDNTSYPGLYNSTINVAFNREMDAIPSISREELEVQRQDPIVREYAERVANNILAEHPLTQLESESNTRLTSYDGDFQWEMLGSQNISLRAEVAGTGYSSSMIFGTPGIIDEEPTIYGERFDNIIIISSSNPLSSYTRQTQGWGRGYVILESDNMLSKRSSNWKTLDIDVHGGITYNNKITEDFIETKFGKSLHLTSDDIGKTILGFDTNHYSSKELFPTRESVLEETTKLALQCAAY